MYNRSAQVKKKHNEKKNNYNLNNRSLDFL